MTVHMSQFLLLSLLLVLEKTFAANNFDDLPYAHSAFLLKFARGYMMPMLV